MLPTLFEDELILAIEKPSGTPSHSLIAGDDFSCEAILKIARPKTPLYLLHRLDTGTSGVLLFGKSESVYSEMREKFKEKSVKKFYSAWSLLTPESQTIAKRLALPLRIDLPLAHHPKNKKKMMVLPPDKHRHFRGKPIPALSIVHQIVTSSFAATPAHELQIEIVTGVMHQIRVHLEYLGFPLLGDPVYRRQKEDEPNSRLALHARQIEFELQGFQYKIRSEFTFA